MNSKNNWLDIQGRWKRISLYSLVGVFLWVAPEAEAYWRVSPDVGVGIEYDDNTRLNDVPGLSSSETNYAIDASAVFFYDSPLTDFRITPRLRSRRFNDNSDLDSNDQFLRFDLKHNREKSGFRFRGDYSSESVRTAERADVDFDIEDPEEIPADDTGRVFDTGKRDRVRLSPEFSYELSQRISLRVTGDYKDTSYDDDVSLILNGFTEYDIGASLGYGLSEKDTILLRARAGKFEADGLDSDSTSNDFGIGYNRRLSERTQLRLFVGGDSSEDESGDDQSNPVGEISIIHRYLTTNVMASFRRTTNGSGSGEIGLRDAVSLTVTRRLSPKLLLRGGIRAYSMEALDSSNTSFVERDYVQIRASATWNFSRTVSFDLDYRYSDIDRDVPNDDAVNGDSNRIGLWVHWHPNPLPN